MSRIIDRVSVETRRRIEAEEAAFARTPTEANWQRFCATMRAAEREAEGWLAGVVTFPADRETMVRPSA